MFSLCIRRAVTSAVVPSVFSAPIRTPRKASRSTIRSSRTPVRWFATVLSLCLCHWAFADVDFAPIAEQATRAVVLIKDGNLGGTGFIVSPDGKIATNAHIVFNLTQGQVELADGTTYGRFHIVGLDLLRDLAVIEIDGSDLPWLKLGDSEKVRSGDPIAIIGSPLGLTGTVTTGVISAVRENKGTKILQTDAAVNLGSSGAPIVDTKGRVVGIVTSKLANTENLNFAVPASALQVLLDHRDAPRTPEEERDFLKSTADWIIDEPGRYARTWDSLDGKTSSNVWVSDRLVRAEVPLPANDEQLGGKAKYVFEKKGPRWSGRLVQQMACLGITNGQATVKVCPPSTFPAELTLITPYRIEGRTEAPPQGTRFDCASCRYLGSASWNDFVWLPSSGQSSAESNPTRVLDQ